MFPFTDSTHSQRRTRWRALAAAASYVVAMTVATAQVTAPPLPPGSHLVNVQAGMNPAEQKRLIRPHHHKGHHKKDYTRDDSVREAPAPAAVPDASVSPFGPMPGSKP